MAQRETGTNKNGITKSERSRRREFCDETAAGGHINGHRAFSVERCIFDFHRSRFIRLVAYQQRLILALSEKPERHINLPRRWTVQDGQEPFLSVAPRKRGKLANF